MQTGAVMGTNAWTYDAGAVDVVWGMYLRGLRQRQGLRLADVVHAGAVGSIATLSRIETAATPLTEDTLLRLLRHYGAEDPTLSQKVRGMDRHRAWRHGFRDALPGWIERWACVEENAAEISMYEARFVPEQLQTPEYACALRAAEPLGRDEQVTDRRKAATCPLYSALVGEAALLRPIGGDAVLRGQLEDLYSRLENDGAGVSVRILPSAAWEQAVPSGASVTQVTFPEESPVRTVVYVRDSLRGGTYLTEPPEVEWHRASLRSMWMQAATRHQSLAMVRRRLQALSSCRR